MNRLEQYWEKRPLDVQSDCTVYLARRPGSNEKVIIKVLDTSRLDPKRVGEQLALNAAKRFAAAAELRKENGSRLRHHVPIIETGVEGGNHWYAAPFFANPHTFRPFSLKTLIADGDSIHSSGLKTIIQGVLQGLKEWRSLGCSGHGGIKLNNVFLNRLNDLESATVLLADPQFLNETTSPAEDLRSIGLLIYQLVRRKELKDGEDWIIPKELDAQWKRLGSENEANSWLRLTQRLLDPEFCFTLEELEKELDTFQGGNSSSRIKLPAILVIAALVAGILVAIFLLDGKQPTNQVKEIKVTFTPVNLVDATEMEFWEVSGATKVKLSNPAFLKKDGAYTIEARSKNFGLVTKSFNLEQNSEVEFDFNGQVFWESNRDMVLLNGKIMSGTNATVPAGRYELAYTRGADRKESTIIVKAGDPPQKLSPPVRAQTTQSTLAEVTFESNLIDQNNFFFDAITGRKLNPTERLEVGRHYQIIATNIYGNSQKSFTLTGNTNIPFNFNGVIRLPKISGLQVLEGQSPLIGTGTERIVRAGKFELKLSAPGYASLVTNFTLFAGEIKELGLVSSVSDSDTQARPIPVRVYFTSSITNEVSYYLVTGNRSNLIRSPRSFNKGDNYTIAAFSPKYGVVTTNGVADADKTNRFNFTGEVLFPPNTPGAILEVEGKTYKGDVAILPVGSYPAALSATNFETQRFTLDVHANQPYRLKDLLKSSPTTVSVTLESNSKNVTFYDVTTSPPNQIPARTNLLLGTTYHLEARSPGFDPVPTNFVTTTSITNIPFDFFGEIKWNARPGDSVKIDGKDYSGVASAKLPPGIYPVVFSRSGFVTLETNVEVSKSIIRLPDLSNPITLFLTIKAPIEFNLVHSKGTMVSQLANGQYFASGIVDQGSKYTISPTGPFKNFFVPDPHVATNNEVKPKWAVSYLTEVDEGLLIAKNSSEKVYIPKAPRLTVPAGTLDITYRGFSTNVTLEKDKTYAISSLINLSPPKPQFDLWTNDLGIVFVNLPNNALPGSNVRSVGRFEVSQRQFLKVMDRKDSRPELVQAGPRQINPDLPEVNLDPDDVRNFCEQLTAKERMAGKIGTNQYYEVLTVEEYKSLISRFRLSLLQKHAILELMETENWGGKTIHPCSEPQKVSPEAFGIAFLLGNAGEILLKDKQLVAGGPSYVDERMEWRKSDIDRLNAGEFLAQEHGMNNTIRFAKKDVGFRVVLRDKNLAENQLVKVK